MEFKSKWSQVRVKRICQGKTGQWTSLIVSFKCNNLYSHTIFLKHTLQTPTQLWSPSPVELNWQISPAVYKGRQAPPRRQTHTRAHRRTWDPLFLIWHEEDACKTNEKFNQSQGVTIRPCCSRSRCCARTCTLVCDNSLKIRMFTEIQRAACFCATPMRPLKNKRTRAQPHFQPWEEC